MGACAGRDLQLLQQIVEAEPRHDPAEADAERALLVMDAHRDHRFLEARIADARHGEQELAAQEAWRIHGAAIGASRERGQSPSPYQGPEGLAKGAGLLRGPRREET